MRVKARSKKPLFMIAAFALIVALSIGLTSAFLTHKTEGLTNTFTPGSVTCRVEEGFNGNNEKSSITVRNTGTVPAYIRVAVVANTVVGILTLMMATITTPVSLIPMTLLLSC